MTQRPRKRSHAAALVLMMPATTLLMTACSEEPEAAAVVYSSVQECQQQHPNPDEFAQCQTDYEQAAALHPKVAPRYQSLQECEADFGERRCEISPERQQYASSGGGFFMPMMMGYMAGQMFSRPQMGPSAFSAGAQPRDNVRRDDNQGSGFAAGGARGSVQTQPLYKSRDDSSTYRTASNAPVAGRTGAVNVRPQALAVRTGGASRIGGFGATAASHASSGG